MYLTADMNELEIIIIFVEHYNEANELMFECCKSDPKNEPYRSKYKARKMFCNMRDALSRITNTNTSLGKVKLEAMLGVVLLNIGIIDMETEKLTASEQVLTEAEALLSPNSTKPEVVNTLIVIYNKLGILLSNCNDPVKAKDFLLKGNELYENFKRTSQIPMPIERLYAEGPAGEDMVLEKAHTVTLYYLAQVYGSLKENLKSVMYSHVMMSRQLKYAEYTPIEWASNAVMLSQFFAEQSGFYQTRHYLAAASVVLEQYEEKLQASESKDEVFLAKLETLKHRSADVARSWAKYCLLLMTSSKARLMCEVERSTEPITDMSNLMLQDDEKNICGGDLRTLIFSELDVSKYENQIGDKFLVKYQDAREVFLGCQNWLNKAKEYYKLDTLASDYIELIQDSSQSYCYLAFFEEDDERRAKMHKRRIDMLEDLVKEINPTDYMKYCRQLWFELGEVYSDILDIKLDNLNKTNEKPSPHVLKKINMFCEKSIENYEHFLSSVKDKGGNVPARLKFELIRPVISAFAFIGQNSTKRIATDKNIQLTHMKKSLDSYQTVVDICMGDEDAAEMMLDEFNMCRKMVKILSIKIKKLKIELRAKN